MSEDSFESETLRSDLISTVGGLFALSLPEEADSYRYEELVRWEMRGGPLSLSLGGATLRVA